MPHEPCANLPFFARQMETRPDLGQEARETLEETGTATLLTTSQPRHDDPVQGFHAASVSSLSPSLPPPSFTPPFILLLAAVPRLLVQSCFWSHLRLCDCCRMILFALKGVFYKTAHHFCLGNDVVVYNQCWTPCYKSKLLVVAFRISAYDFSQWRQW